MRTPSVETTNVRICFITLFYIIARSTNDIFNTVNITSADSSLTGTEAKKMAALERFKAMEANIMPRDAINQFVEANQSEAQTPALFFGNDEDMEEQ